MASTQRIIPPIISRYFEGNFLNKFPNQNPATDIKNDVNPIIRAGTKSAVFVNFKLTPEARASMLVAIPKVTRQIKPKQ